MEEEPRTDIEKFALRIAGRRLYPYQAEIANAILHSINNNLGHIITVLCARQMGKNELSAILEAFLLHEYDLLGGTIVKAAPTFKPQIINSRLRLMAMLRHDLLKKRVWSSFGYMIGLAPFESEKRAQTGARILLFSAEPESNVVGATASILLEIDEAQDVDPQKFDRDFRPMASTTNATTVMYGTAWSDDTLLARQKAINQEIEERTGEKRHFEYDWRVLAKINDKYKQFVEAEIERLGEEHVSIQTQYFLHEISGAGRFFSDMQLDLMRGTFAYQSEPSDDEIYIAGMDVAGEDRPMEDGTPSRTRDSTIVTIGRVVSQEERLPRIEVVHHQWWTGMHHEHQFQAAVALIEKWSIKALCIDYTGLGQGLASLLMDRFNSMDVERVQPFTFTRPSKSRLAYQLLALVNRKGIAFYRKEGAPYPVHLECWKQLRKAKSRLYAPEVIDFYVPPEEGHDDFLISLALIGEALEQYINPPESTIIKPKKSYTDESKY